MSMERLLSLAKKLEEKGYAIEVVHEGRVILKLGRGAKPGLLRALGPVEVRDLRTLLSFIKL
ncbi:MAG: hypothetical protein GXO66_02985 [Euryarchaeota archaeon]|nr:hypothetical protein [Euryarchaeota archaeon]